MGARVYLASIARFTSLDPVAGGTANNYVYALDPINFSDYSGNCILQCAGGSSLQGSTRIVQGSSPAIQGSKAAVQTTISSQRLQGTRATTIYIRAIPKSTAKPAARTYDNSTARGVARVAHMALEFAAVPPYAEYFVTYKVRHFVVDHAQGFQYMPLNYWMLGIEATGLSMDAGIDLLKGESVGDEAQKGCTLPWHSTTGFCGPYIYLPGISNDGKIDW